MFSSLVLKQTHSVSELEYTQLIASMVHIGGTGVVECTRSWPVAMQHHMNCAVRTDGGDMN
jgi:hypothetical protein